MLKSHLCDCSDAYVLVKGTKTTTGVERVGTASQRQTVRETDKIDKQVMFKSCESFTDCIIEINNAQIHNAKELDLVMPIYNNTVMIIQQQKVYVKMTKMSQMIL